MRHPRALTLLLLAAVGLSNTPLPGQSKRDAPPNLVLTGGRVFTADSLNPWAHAIAIRGTRIIAVGSDADILKLAAKATRRIALGGRLVVPGFNDAHTHIQADGSGVRFATSESPTPESSFEVVLDSLTAIANRTPSGVWISTTVGDVVLSDSTARRAALDPITRRNPVMLSGWTGHGAILNTRAIVAARLDTLNDPEGGWFERDADGRPTGRIDEYVLFNLGRRRAARGSSTVIAAFRAFDREAAALGITSTQNMATGLTPPLLAAVERAGALRLRHRVIPFEMTGTGKRESLWRGVRPSNALTVVSGRKVIVDGTPIERLALMREPYADRRGWYGRANWSLDTLKAILREALELRQQPLLHAVGDSAIALIFTAMRDVAADSTWRRVRPRLEHADNFMEDQFADARQLGIVVVQNPTHLLPEFTASRWNPPRSARSEVLRSMATYGIPLAIGSDGPLNPFLNLMLAARNPANPPQALTLEQAVVAYTRMSAYAEHAENDKGSLARGKLADLAVLSQDIFAVPLEALPATTSVLTLVGGRATHDQLTTSRSKKIR